MSQELNLDQKVTFIVSGMPAKRILGLDTRLGNGTNNWTLRRILEIGIHQPETQAKYGIAKITWKTDIAKLIPGEKPKRGSKKTAEPEGDTPPPANGEESSDLSTEGTENVKAHIEEDRLRANKMLLSPIKFPELGKKKAKEVADGCDDVTKLVEVYTLIKQGTRGLDKLPILKARILELDPNNTYVNE